MKNLIKKFGAFSIGPIFAALIGFINVPIITHFISPDEYGKSSMFILAQSTLSIFLYMGMDQAFVREFNEFKDNKVKLFSNTILIPGITVFLLDFIIVIKAEWISYMLFGSSKYIYCSYLLALMLPFMIIETFSLLAIRMEEKGIIYSTFIILLKALTLILTVCLFMFYDKSFQSVVYALGCAEIINTIVLYVFSRSYIKISVKSIDKDLILRMLKFGLPLMPAAALGWGLSSIDKIMLRTMCNYTELGLYSASFKIVNILGILQSCFTLFWVPVAYRWYERGEKVQKYEKIGKLVAVLMTIICLGILLFRNILIIILGNSFEKSISIFPFLLIYPIMYTLSEVTTVGIAFMRKTHYNILISLISGLSNLFLNYLLIPAFGGIGAAVATGISYMVFFWARTYFSRKCWEKFNCKIYYLVSLSILASCYACTFLNNYLSYTILIINMVLWIIYVFRECKAEDIVKEFLKN